MPSVGESGFGHRFLHRSLLFCAVAALVSKTTESAEPGKILREYRQTVWTTKDGLPSDIVRSLLQTRDGYLWIGTQFGLARFDGMRFLVFDHENSPLPVQSLRVHLAEDSQGTLWIGTEQGLFAYRHGAFKQYTTADGLWHNEVRLVHTGPSGRLWIGTEGGLNGLANGQITRLEVHEPAAANGRKITGLFEDESGLLWIADPCEIQRRQIRTWNREVLYSRSNPVNAIVLRRDQRGRVWAGNNESLFQWSDGTWTNRLQMERHPIFLTAITHIAVDREGTLWLGTGVLGLGRLRNGVFDQIDSRHGLPSDWVICFHEDREGNLWLGTHEGLVCWHKRRFESVTTRDGLHHDSVACLLRSRDESLWIGTDGGLNRYTPTTVANAPFQPQTNGTFTAHPFSNHPLKFVQSLLEDAEGHLWVGTLDGIKCFRNGQYFDYRLPGGRDGNKVRALALGLDGSVWAGTELGLHRFHEGRVSTFTKANGLSQDVVWALHRDRAGDLWVGTLGGGVNRIHLEAATASDASQNASEKAFSSAGADVTKVKSPNDPARPVSNKMISLASVATLGRLSHSVNSATLGTISVLSTTNGLSNDAVFSFYEDAAGALWIGTDRGLNRLQEGRLASFTTRDGLYDDQIYEILEDDLGHLWIGCDRGLYHVPKRDLNEVAAGRAKSVSCVVYDEKDGLFSDMISGRKSQPASCKAPDGRLWFATNKGVVIIDPKKIHEHDVPPTVVIEQVNANDQTVFGNSGSARPLSILSESDEPARLAADNARRPASQTKIKNQKSKIRLPPGSGGVLRFQFTAPSFIAPERVRFKHRLEGHNADWIDAGTERVAYYTSVPPGDYRFQVIACNHHGVWNDSGATFAFSLAPYFYQIWSFRTLSGLGLILAAYGVHRRRLAVQRKIHRLEQQNAVAQERERIARDMHDEIGSDLHRLAMLIGVDPERREREGSQPNENAKLIALARDISRGLDEIVWTVQPEQDRFDQFVTYLSQYAHEYLEGTSIRLRLDFPDRLSDWPMSAEVRHNLFLVAKEALHNSARHSGASEIQLRLKLTGSVLALELRDNGRGFDVRRQSGLHPGDGLANMQSRLAKIGGRFECESQPGGGTAIKASVELRPDGNGSKTSMRST